MYTSIANRLSLLLGPADGLRSQLLRGTSASMLLKVLNAGIGLVLAIILARALGPEGYGIYAFAFSLVSLLAMPAQVGLPTLLVRQVARYQLHEQWGLLRGLLKRANQITGVLTLLIIPAAAISAWFVFQHNGEASTQLLTFYWALALVPMIALGNLRGAALRGLRRVVQGQLPEMLIRPGLLLILVLSAAYMSKLTPQIAMALHVLAAWLAFGFGTWLLLKHLPADVWNSRPIYDTPAWLRSMLPLSLLAGMQVINGQTDIVMLGALTTDEDVGIYRVAVQGATLVAFGLGAANMVVAPHFARLYAAHDMVRLQRMVTASARGIFMFALPVALTFILFGAGILNLLFGPAYTAGHVALAILCAGQLVNAGFGSVGLLLNMSGHEHITTYGVTVAAVVNVVLNAMLIPLYGIEGAAAASAISLIVWNAVLWKGVRKHLCIESTMIGIPKKRRYS